MKEFIKLFADDYKRENIGAQQFIIATAATLLALLFIGLVEYFDRC